MIDLIMWFGFGRCKKKKKRERKNKYMIMRCALLRMSKTKKAGNDK